MYKIKYLRQTASTNDEARDGGYVHGDVVVTDRQTAGRGQRGNGWESEPGKNLTFSVVLEPRFLAAERQFLLSEAVSLAVADMLFRYGISAEVKWPNDIYIDGRKAAGILIENDIAGSVVLRSVVGVGLNVNQTEFDPSLPNPTSMKLAAGHDFELREVLDHFLMALTERYDILKNGDPAILKSDYHRRLYRIDVLARYTLPDGNGFSGIIKGVSDNGALIVSHPDGSISHYLFKEIEYVK